MKILIACEMSGIVREAFAAMGHDAWSCDLLPSLQPGQHIQTDAADVLADGWDMMIAHPPCTYLSDAGERWWHKADHSYRWALAIDAYTFFMKLVNAPIAKIIIENPKSSRLKKWYRAPDDIIQPYYFGDPAEKQTWLWLKGVVPLWRTGVCETFERNWANGCTVAHTGAARSKTFEGIATAMAAQWG